MSTRYMCRLSPCIPSGATGNTNYRPDAYTGQSFGTRDAYDRHIRRGHLLQPDAPGVPAPYVITRLERWEEAAS